MRERVQIFVDAGLLHSVPTRWQLLHGELEMTPYVLSTDATAETGYRNHLASRPIVRQPHGGYEPPKNVDVNVNS